MVREVTVERSDGASLTALCSCSGCGAKLAAADLLPIVRALPAENDERLLVGHTSGDDAAAFRLTDELALVQTVDFFTPLVDDPYDFGRIAAANALSDVYAMGGVPVTALNVVAFPLQQQGAYVLGEILRGGSDILRTAGTALVGGHSIKDREPKYGLAVSGLVDPASITTNDRGCEDDVLVLTKPLGVGAIVTAHKRGVASDELLDQAVSTMITLNDEASRAAVDAGVRAMTDVTGYGLLGHVHNLCRASGLAADIDAASVPAIAGVGELLATDAGISSGSRRNMEWASAFADINERVTPWRRWLLADATTSGGLLVAVQADKANRLPGTIVGRLRAGTPGAITVR